MDRVSVENNRFTVFMAVATASGGGTAGVFLKGYPDYNFAELLAVCVGSLITSISVLFALKSYFRINRLMENGNG
ncbi:MAG: hypothetical protein GXO18_06190 [Aquificae bacterium]|nr:hypothetical protein [Aquificota bacterium]